MGRRQLGWRRAALDRARRGVFGLALASTALLAVAGTPPRGSAPRVALLVGEPLGTHTEVVAEDASGARKSIGSVEHAPGAALRAATGRGGDVLVVADVGREPDLSFAGELFLVRENAPTRSLAGSVVHASTPLALADGRALVSRGVAGVVGDQGRVDDLTVDAIDPESGAIETIASFRGYVLFIAGRTADGVILYRVGETGADLALVDLATKASLPLAKIAPYARDFSVDDVDQTLVFVDRDGPDWVTSRLDLTTRAVETIERGPSMQIVPRVLPGGDLIRTLDPAHGAERASGARLDLGRGVARIVALDASGSFATGVTNDPGALGKPFVVELATGSAHHLSVPSGSRAVVAGFLEGGSR